MSQIPPPAPYQPQQPSQYSVPPRSSTNGWAITSLVLGIIGFCIPFVGGLLATIFGIVGIAKGRKRGSGTGLAIAGLVLGLISLAVWMLFGTAIFAAIGMTKANRTVATQFIKDVHAGNITAAQAATDGSLTKEELDTMSQDLKALGSLTDVTTLVTNVVNDNAHLDGLISFGDKKQPYSMEQVKSGGTWKIKSFSTVPIGATPPVKPNSAPDPTTEQSPEESKPEPAPAGQ